MAAKTYKVWCPDVDVDEANAHTVRDMSHELAAEMWAEQYDRKTVEFGIAKRSSDEPVTVYVRGEGRIRIFKVCGEMCVAYYAKEVG